MQSTRRAQCASGVGSSCNASNLDFAFSKELSTACKNSTRLSPFYRQLAIACRSHLIPCRSVDASPLWSCRMYLKVNRIGTWSRGSPAGMSCSLRPEIALWCEACRSGVRNIVAIEVLSVFLSRFSISCPATFCSLLWNSPHVAPPLVHSLP